MAKRTPPPIDHPITDNDGVLTVPWVLYFNQDYVGDTGTVWTPAFTSLTSVGSPSFTGRYIKLTQKISYFTATITPVTNTSSVAGTTYINNFPLSITANGACFAVSGNVGSDVGMIAQSSGRIYTPAWTTVAVPVTVCGLVEAE